MKSRYALSLVLAALCAVLATGRPSAQEQQKPVVKIPDAGVPQIMTIEGTYIRAAYNNEGYVILGYKTANMSLNEEWMLLEMGTTVRNNVPAFTLKRDDVSLSLSEGAKLPLASVEDYRGANLRGLENRAKVARDSINYFPPMASQPCRIGFFSDLSSPAQSWDQVEVSEMRACSGRLFFKIPGGIKYGQYFLNVQFPQGIVRVPFRILTEDEEKMLEKNYKDIRKQVQAAFAPPKKKGS